MSVLITLGMNREYKGTFTQRKTLWAALEELQGIEKTFNMAEIVDLVIQDDGGKIESTTGSDKRYTQCTYAKLCTAMRSGEKVAIHDAHTFEPIYGIWQSEPNVIYMDTPGELC